jgi:D-alanyl-D-alanine carboxypeptidase
MGRGVWVPKKGYYEQAYGKAALPNTSATVADHFRIGSITKTVFAAAVLQQVAAGTLKLTDTVVTLIPAFAKGEKLPAIGGYSTTNDIILGVLLH